MTDRPRRTPDEDSDELEVTWPDPSPLSDWWDEVMGLTARERHEPPHTFAA